MMKLRHLWRNLVRRDRVDDEIQAELRGTLDMLEDEGRAAGLTPDAARRAAVLSLGRPEPLKERILDVKAGAFLQTWLQDARYALRLLRRGPLFAGFAIASLALGIGATGAIFLLYDVVALRTLDVPEPGRLVLGSFGKGERFNYSLPFPQFTAIRERATTLDSVFGLSPMGRVTVGATGTPEAADGVYVTGDYYRVLRLTPAAGRLLDAADDRSGQPLAVLNHAFWQRRFGGRADVVGMAITLNKIAFTVVGVEPRGFSGTEVGRPHDIAVPLGAYPLLNEGRPHLTGPFTTWLYVMGRLKPGGSIAAAEQETRAIFTRVGLDRARNAGEEKMAREDQFRLETGARGNASALRNRYEKWLGMVLMLLGAVLLLASLNVATLLLSRSDARQREIATRLALGASRWRVIRQLTTEALVLGACAGAAGLAIAAWGGEALLRIALPAVERLPIDISINARLVAFVAVVTTATCIVFGALPAIRATSVSDLAGSRVIRSRRRRAFDRGLVAAQVALSLVLLVTAGLFLRTLEKLWAQDPGYDRQNVLMFSADARLAGLTSEEIPRAYGQLLDELRTVPGALAVTMSAVRPVSENYYFIDSFTEIGSKTLPPERRVRVAYNHVAPGYFATLGIPLVAGREFDARDTRGAPRVVIISERMARHFEGNPVGQTLGRAPSASQVIGVVKDVRYANVKDAEREVVYHPIFQSAPKDMFYAPTYEIRYAGDAAALLPSIRASVSRVDPGLTMIRVTTLEQQTQDSFARERLLAWLASYFGGFAVLLACIGLYGLVSYGVTQRTAEMGLRMALGAQPSSLRRLIVRESLGTVIGGTVAGLFVALAVVRLMRSQLFGVEPHDPIALAAASVLLLTASLIAAYLPARRASRIDPLTALRTE
jgi:predicted permease